MCRPVRIHLFDFFRKQGFFSRAVLRTEHGGESVATDVIRAPAVVDEIAPTADTADLSPHLGIRADPGTENQRDSVRVEKSRRKDIHIVAVNRERTEAEIRKERSQPRTHIGGGAPRDPRKKDDRRHAIPLADRLDPRAQNPLCSVDADVDRIATIRPQRAHRISLPIGE